jgi:hypothetical protein
VSAEDDKRSGRPSTSKTTENVENFENSSTNTIAEQSMSLQETLTENLKMSCTAPSSGQGARPHVPENQTVCDSQHGYRSPSSLFARFCFVPQIENETEGMII